MRSFRAVLIGTACVFSSAGTAWAQETLTVSGTAAPAPTDVAGADGDIVVTAQRRNERLQDVPVSITALSGDQLADKRIASPTDLVSSVPNLQAASTVGEGIPVFSLRGISMSDYSINQQGPVATYIIASQEDSPSIKQEPYHERQGFAHIPAERSIRADPEGVG